jgi:hypothetical protein
MPIIGEVVVEPLQVMPSLQEVLEAALEKEPSGIDITDIRVKAMAEALMMVEVSRMETSSQVVVVEAMEANVNTEVFKANSILGRTVRHGETTGTSSLMMLK